MAELSSSSEDEDSVPLSTIRARLNQGNEKQPAELSSSSSDEEEVTLASVRKRITASKSKAAAAAKRTVTQKRKNGGKSTPAKRRTKTTKRKSASKSNAKNNTKAKSSKTSSKSSNSDDNGYTALFQGKGFKISLVRKRHLVEGILIRWKYVLEWPPRSAVMPTPPDGYIMLRGYPGVYVGIHGEVCGNILDNRKDRSNIPSNENLMKKSCITLQDMLLAAIEKQKAELKAHDGPKKLLDALDIELKNVRRVNAQRLDGRKKN